MSFLYKANKGELEVAVESSLSMMWERLHTQIPEDTESGTSQYSYPFDILTEQDATSVIFGCGFSVF